MLYPLSRAALLCACTVAICQLYKTLYNSRILETTGLARLLPRRHLPVSGSGPPGGRFRALPDSVRPRAFGLGAGAHGRHRREGSPDTRPQRVPGDVRRQVRRGRVCAARVREEDATNIQGRHRACENPAQTVDRIASEVTMKMTRSSGNVFADLGFDKETAENLRIRADLMIELRDVIQRKGR